MDSYNDIIYSNFSYKLPELETSIIANLIKTLGCTNQDVVEDKNNKYKRTSHNRKTSTKRTEEPWEKPKPFVSTKLDKKEGVEKTINDIRICLNKMSTKNYEAQREVIFEHFNDIDNNEDYDRIITSLIEIASSNKFYSSIYTNLYKELLEKHPLFNNRSDEIVSKYMASIELIEYVDSNVDYDKYCENNKKNDKRKGLAMFIVNLMKNGLIDKTVLLKIIIDLQNMIIKYVDEDNKYGEVDEIIENVYILITTTTNELKEESNWENVMSSITQCSKLKAKDHKSLSSKTVFKYMDLLDNLSTV
jgi:hypothetical protein